MSTLLGWIVALANAYANVEWTNFEPNLKHIMPLIISGVIALGGHMTSINIKSNGNSDK
jgi:hypothetical protein